MEQRTRGWGLEEGTRDNTQPAAEVHRWAHPPPCAVGGGGSRQSRRFSQDGTTALYVAAEFGRLEVVRLLLGKGADVDRAKQVCVPVRGFMRMSPHPHFPCERESRVCVCARARVPVTSPCRRPPFPSSGPARSPHPSLSPLVPELLVASAASSGSSSSSMSSRCIALSCRFVSY